MPSKRVSVNYGDVNEDLLKYASKTPQKPRPGRKTLGAVLNPGGSASANTSPYPDGRQSSSHPLRSQRSFNDEALAMLSGTLQKEDPYSPPPVPPTFSPNLSDKRHSSIEKRYRPATIAVSKKRFLVAGHMLSPIDTSGSESFSPTGLGLDLIVKPSKVRDLDDDDDDEEHFVYPKSATSPRFENLEPQPQNSPARLTPDSAHSRSKSFNFHLRSRSMTVRLAPVTLPLVNIRPDASFADIASEYPHCVPVHTRPRRSLLELQMDQLSVFGLRNLALMLVFINNIGLVAEYYSEYANVALLQSLFYLFRYNTDVQFFLGALALTPVYYMYMYVVEKILYLLTLRKFNSLVRSKFLSSALSASKDEFLGPGRDGLSFRLTNTVLQQNYLLPVFTVLYMSAIGLVFAVNNFIIIKMVYNPVLGTILEIHTIVCVFKIASFALSNKSLRELYFKSINTAKYLRYLKNRKHLISEDGTLNVKKELHPEIMSGRVTGAELAETFNTLKQRGLEKSQPESNPEDDDESFVDQDLQPAFYKDNEYPNNITVREVFYFSAIPSLVYQPVYPKSGKTNWKYCADKIMEMIFLSLLIFYLSYRFAIPILKDSVLNTLGQTIGLSNQLHIVEILIELADVSILIWVISYYMVFHDFLNLLAELTNFGDRDFYAQWWNSGSVGGYWKSWNCLFSNFFDRHFYRPLLISREKRQIPTGDESKKDLDPAISTKVNFFMFLMMAVLQELVVGVPTGNMMGISFVCIIMQSPLSIMTNPIDKLRGENSTVGNIIFWVSFIIGQPLCILLYYFTWTVKYGELSSY